MIILLIVFILLFTLSFTEHFNEIYLQDPFIYKQLNKIKDNGLDPLNYQKSLDNFGEYKKYRKSYQFPKYGKYSDSVDVIDNKSYQNKSILYQGSTLKQGDSLISSNNRFKAVYQTDGNFVIYNSTNRPLWASNTSYNEIWRKSNRLIMQSDGNLVIYNNRTPIWASNTSGSNGLYIIMKNNGKLVIYTANNRVVWST